jgi:hypothetical protein
VLPTITPSKQPSYKPLNQPSKIPSAQPITIPTRHPTMQPSSQPTRNPSRQPTSVQSNPLCGFPVFNPLNNPVDNRLSIQLHSHCCIHRFNHRNFHPFNPQIDQLMNLVWSQLCNRQSFPLSNPLMFHHNSQPSSLRQFQLHNHPRSRMFSQVISQLCRPAINQGVYPVTNHLLCLQASQHHNLP